MSKQAGEGQSVHGHQGRAREHFVHLVQRLLGYIFPVLLWGNNSNIEVPSQISTFLETF